jgi:hypothetical protein
MLVEHLLGGPSIVNAWSTIVTVVDEGPAWGNSFERRKRWVGREVGGAR